MAELYYSQRQKRNQQVPQVQVGSDFWTAFLTYLNRRSNDNYFCKAFPDHCSDGHQEGRNDQLVASRIREELGEVQWPIPNGEGHELPDTERILDVLEFFFKHVAKSTQSRYHDHCGGSHPTEYDVAQGRYEYTVQINGMLKRFHHPYKLQKGSIVLGGSEVMDARVSSVELKTQDAHLLRLLGSALDNFYDRSGTKKLEGLRSLVDAFERLKTLEDEDKKTSVTKVIGKLSVVEEIRQHYEQHLRKLTELANKYTIRHHEAGKVVLDDESTIEYLFYSYDNLIRLILEKYEMVENVY